MNINETLNRHEAYNETTERLKDVLLNILENGRVTEEDNAELEDLMSKEKITYEEIKKIEETEIQKEEEEKTILSKEQLVNILTDDGERTLFSIDDEGGVVMDGTAIPQFTVLAQKLDLIATDGEDFSEIKLTPTFIEMISKEVIIKANQVVIEGDLTVDGAITANKAEIEDLKVKNAQIENLVADKASIGQLNADKAEIKNLLADKASIGQLTANKAEIDELVANKADITELNAINGNITQLKSDVAKIGTLQANVANINDLLAGNITAENIATGAITAGSSIIANGAIGSAQISEIDASKISAGKIDTSKVEVAGTNSHLRLKGNRLQVFQGTGNSAKERVSLGDVNADGSVYGLRVRGADGKTVLIDENGVKEEGITDGSITNNKISDDANIDGAKLNINSVVNKINEDGTETINGTKIQVDGQSLNTKLSTITIKQTEDREKITQAQSQITANTDSIKLKVDNQTYQSDKKDMTAKMEKNTSDISLLQDEISLKVSKDEIEQKLDEISGDVVDSKINSAKAEIKITTDEIKQNVSKMNTTLSKKADGTTVTTLSDKVGTLETNVNGITQRVSDTEVETSNLKSKLNDTNSNMNNLTTRVSTAESKLTKDSLTTTIGNHYTTSNDVNGIVMSKGYQTQSQVQQTTDALQAKFTQSGGYNLLRNSCAKNGTTYWYSNGGGISTGVASGGEKLGQGTPYFHSSFPSGITGDWVQLKPDTDYIYSAKIWVGTNYNGTTSTPLHYWCSTTQTSGSSQLTIIDYNQTCKANIWNDVYIHFKTKTGVVYFKPFVYTGGSTNINFSVSELMLCEGVVKTPYSPHPSEVYDGITTIDRDGITVTSSNVKSKTSMSSNGFKITKTDTNEDVFKVNNDGTLYMKGNIQVTNGSVPTSLLSGTISNSQLNSSIISDISTAQNNASSALTKANTAITDSSTAKTNASSAVSTANTANSNASTALSTANTAKNTADSAQNTANTVKSTVDTNSANWSNAYNRVVQWANGAVTGTTNINGGMIATNTITANKIAVGDFNNYFTLNSTNATLYGYRTAYSTGSGKQEVVIEGNNLKRDNSINNMISCEPNEKLLIKGSVYTNVKKDDVYVPVSIMIVQYNDQKQVISYNAIKYGSNTSITYNNEFTLSETTRYFSIWMQCNDTTPFTGGIYIRDNVVVMKKTTGELIVDGSITTSKIHTDGLNANTIKSGTISADRIGANTITADKININDLTALRATIGGFNIKDGAIYSTNIGLGRSGKEWAFWAGSDTSNSAPFRVGHEGEVYANNIKTTGGTIGGFGINSTQLYSSDWKVGMCSAGGDNTVALWAGTNNFELRHNGNTKWGGNTGNKVDNYERAKCEINSEGTFYNVASNKADNYVKIADGNIYAKKDTRSEMIFNENGLWTTKLYADNSVTSGFTKCSGYNTDNSSMKWGINGASVTGSLGDNASRLEFTTISDLKYFRPCYNGTVRSGSTSYPWYMVYSKNGVSTTSDRTMKENIRYVDKVKDVGITTKDEMFDFIKDDYVLAQYNYIGDTEEKVSAIAQDLLLNEDYTDNRIGQMIVNLKECSQANAEGEDAKLTINQTQLLNVTIGALQKAIEKIDKLEKRIEELENGVA